MSELNEIGKELVNFATYPETLRVKRGTLDELFPYVYVASKRMSLRAIGRWLKAEKMISISPTSLARAMRLADQYWKRILEEIDPAVRMVARLNRMSCLEVLASENVIHKLENCPLAVPTGEHDSPEFQARVDEIIRYDKAVGSIKYFWTEMPGEAVKECLRYAPEVFK